MAWLKDKLKLVSNERAVIVGAILSIFSVLAEHSLDNDINWRSAFPVVAGIVIRNFVYGPKAITDLDDKVTEYDEILKEIIENVNRAEAERAQPLTLFAVAVPHTHADTGGAA